MNLEPRKPQQKGPATNMPGHMRQAEKMSLLVAVESILQASERLSCNQWPCPQSCQARATGLKANNQSLSISPCGWRGMNWIELNQQFLILILVNKENYIIKLGMIQND